MRRNGFTLIELLATIVIISILLAFVAPALFKARENAKREKMFNDWKTLEAAAWAYRHEYGRWPCSANPQVVDNQVVQHDDFRGRLDGNGDTQNPRQIKFVRWSDYEIDADGNIADPVEHQPYDIFVNFSTDKMWFTSNWEVVWGDTLE